MRALLCGLVLSASAGLAVAGQDSPLDEADRRAFAWFDGLGLPSCAGRPLVRLTMTKEEPREGEGPSSAEGFLVAETPDSLTLVGDDLWPRDFPRRRTGVRVTSEPLDLGKAAADCLEWMRAEARSGSWGEGPRSIDRFYEGFVGDLPTHARVLVLARRCAENGLEREAHDLLAQAMRIPDPANGKPVPEPIEAFVAGQVADSMLWRITLHHEDPTIPRARLLEEYRGWLRGFPASDRRPGAEEAVRILEAMIAEDAKHESIPEDGLAALPVERRVREWIFRLRDQHGIQWCWPGSPTIFHPFLSPEKVAATPAGRLKALGLAAVPALIEALDDERFTRTVGFHRPWYFSHYVVRVGDAARELLEEITHQRFWEGTCTDSSMIKDGQGAETKERVRAWWKECEGFVLPLGALAAEKDPERRAALARALPHRGPGLIPGAPEGALWGTGRFLEAVPGLGPGEAKEVLHAILAESPHPGTRSLAAWALLDLGDRGGIPAMAALWGSLEPAARADPRHGGAVASFLSSCGDAAAIEVLGKGLDARPPAVRELVLLAFSDGGLGAVRGLAGDAGGGIREPWRLDAAAARACERLLAGRLCDLEEEPLGRVPRQEPLADLDRRFDCGRRLADLAIRVLALRFPDVYRLPDVAFRPAEEWERLRARFTETWKAGNGDEGPR